MSEEIKEILDRMQELVEHKYDKEIHTYNLFDDIQDLLDYITNLQQKVEQLEKENKELKQPQVYIDCENMEERYGRDLYEDYLKEKIEQLENTRKKAIEWIDEHDYYSGSSDIYYFSDFTPSNDLLNILN